MESIKILTKTNGYKAEGLQEMIGKFNKVAARLFPGCTVSHFYYGDHLDMVDISLRPGEYGCFNLTAKRVSFGSHCGTSDDVRKYESMTLNDELFDGKLLELANETN